MLCADLSAKIDGVPARQWCPVYIKKGSILSFGGCVFGCRAYLAVAGGFAVKEVLNSRSTYLRAEIGGYFGRALQEGDELTIGLPAEWSGRKIQKLAEQDAGMSPLGWGISVDVFPNYDTNPMIRVVRGAQFNCFEQESRDEFLSSPFKVLPQSDRMGYRLKGPKLELSEPLEMISEAVASGTVQVPPEGQPIVLLADRQTAGGYPKIAQIISVDLPVIAQTKPGESLRFQIVSLEEAEALYVAREMQIEQVRRAIALRYQ